MLLGRLFFDGQEDLAIIITQQNIFEKENVMFGYFCIEGCFQVAFRAKVISIGIDDSTFGLW